MTTKLTTTGSGSSAARGHSGRHWMKVTVRSLVALTVASVGFLAGPSVVSAGLGASAAPSFPTSVTVGQTGVAASIELTNQNSPVHTADTNTVCNFGDPLPCPVGDPGITLIPSCGTLGAFSSCAAADPGVLQISPTATGQAGTTCAGMIFSVTLIDPVYGQLRFTPHAGHVTLPGAGSVCRIGFVFNVVRTPTTDHDPQTAGVQTVQIVDNTQVSGVLLASARGTSSGLTVQRANPAITTVASPTVTVGAPINDTATVTGRVNPIPGATITFNLYAAGDTTCAAAPIFTSTVPINPNGTANSGSFTTTTTGTHQWIATYNGDANNNPVSGTCGDYQEAVTVTPATPSITTVASPTGIVGAPINDTATVTGRVNPIPGATVTFNLYAAGDTTCAAAPIFTSTVPINPDGTATSGSFTPTTTGTHQWIATYNGDANNNPVSGACGDYQEAVTVTPATPSITTVASPNVSLGAPINDTATVTGRVNPIPGATITFNLYAAGDTTCAAAPMYTSTVPINPDGTATSGSFTPTTTGTYQWIATYNGDANNAAVSGMCGDANETVSVSPVSSSPPVTPVPAPSPAVLGTPAITTVASPSVALTGSVFDTATVTGRVDPIDGATITFNFYGVGDVTCAESPVFTSTVAVNADGTATSASFAPAASGDYRWIATYNGDANNNSVSGVCGEAGEGVTVFGPPPPTATTRLLPATGSMMHDQLTIGGVLLGCGMLLWASSRRRRTVAAR